MRWTMLYAEGRRVPKFYGVAWCEFNTATVVLLPIPINVLARWLRELYFGIGYTKTKREKYEREIFERGREDGLKTAEERVALERRRVRYISKIIFKEEEFIERNVSDLMLR